jgi:hypothetical protein
MSVADINVPVYGFYGSTDARRVEHLWIGVQAWATS